MNKKWWLLSALAALPAVFALDVSGTLSNIWWNIISIGNLSWLGVSDGSIITSFTRILLGILTFTIFFAVITIWGGGKGDTKKAPVSFLNRNQAMIVSFILAVMVAVFLPPSVILAVGVGWATAVALLLIGAPVVGIAYFMWVWPIRGHDTRGTYFLKLILCILLFWILSAMKYHVARMV